MDEKQEGTGHSPSAVSAEDVQAVLRSTNESRSDSRLTKSSSALSSTSTASASGSGFALQGYGSTERGGTGRTSNAPKSASAARAAAATTPTSKEMPRTSASSTAKTASDTPSAAKAALAREEIEEARRLRNKQDVTDLDVALFNAAANYGDAESLWKEDSDLFVEVLGGAGFLDGAYRKVHGADEDQWISKAMFAWRNWLYSKYLPTLSKVVAMATQDWLEDRTKDDDDFAAEPALAILRPFWNSSSRLLDTKQHEQAFREIREGIDLSKGSFETADAKTRARDSILAVGFYVFLVLLPPSTELVEKWLAELWLDQKNEPKRSDFDSMIKSVILPRFLPFFKKVSDRFVQKAGSALKLQGLSHRLYDSFAGIVASTRRVQKATRTTISVQTKRKDGAKGSEEDTEASTLGDTRRAVDDAELAESVAEGQRQEMNQQLFRKAAAAAAAEVQRREEKEANATTAAAARPRPRDRDEDETGTATAQFIQNLAASSADYIRREAESQQRQRTAAALAATRRSIKLARSEGASAETGTQDVSALNATLNDAEARIDIIERYLGGMSATNFGNEDSEDMRNVMIRIQVELNSLAKLVLTMVDSIKTNGEWLAHDQQIQEALDGLNTIYQHYDRPATKSLVRQINDLKPSRTHHGRPSGAPTSSASATSVESESDAEQGSTGSSRMAPVQLSATLASQVSGKRPMVSSVAMADTAGLNSGGSQSTITVSVEDAADATVFSGASTSPSAPSSGSGPSHVNVSSSASSSSASSGSSSSSGPLHAAASSKQSTAHASAGSGGGTELVALGEKGDKAKDQAAAAVSDVKENSPEPNAAAGSAALATPVVGPTEKDELLLRWLVGIGLMYENFGPLDTDEHKNGTPYKEFATAADALHKGGTKSAQERSSKFTVSIAGQRVVVSMKLLRQEAGKLFRELFSDDGANSLIGFLDKGSAQTKAKKAGHAAAEIKQKLEELYPKQRSTSQLWEPRQAGVASSGFQRAKSVKTSTRMVSSRINWHHVK